MNLPQVVLHDERYGRTLDSQQRLLFLQPWRPGDHPAPNLSCYWQR